MKTATYLRMSLLIPFLVWGVCLLIVFLASASPMKELASRETTTLAGLVFLSLAFYALGIIIWVFPYLLLSLILLALSFLIQARVTMKVFALSPIAMTILTVSLVDLLALGSSEKGQILSNPLITDQDFISFNLFVLAFSLIWGYICVGLGFGSYKLLKQRNVIRDEVNTGAELRTIHQYG